jgi:HPt (histidine-containing phosphotransfer) domain-containing protein
MTALPGTMQPNLVFDLAAALERVEGDEELLKEIAQIFLDTVDEMMSEVKSAIVAKDPKRLQSAAHALKGAVANFSAPEATDAAYNLEMKGRNGDMQGWDAGLLRLQIALSQLNPILEKYLTS